MNEHIDREEFSCTYSSFDDAVRLVQGLGRGAWMAKADIKHAFRLCPVLPSQWYLLCYQWLGQFFVDTRLPFGSRSSPFIFNEFAGLLAWVMINVIGILYLLHYLDDYFMTNTTMTGCSRDLSSFTTTCETLGVPLAPGKVLGPAQRLTFLGIEIDTVSMSIRLPLDKLHKLNTSVLEMWERRKVTKRELISFVGFLSFACKVVKPGRIFMRRLLDLANSVSRPHFLVYFNNEARADLQWWKDFLPRWHGVELIQAPPVSSIELLFSTDASDLGLGCRFGNHWICQGWQQGWGEQHINIRELFAIWVAIHTWGEDLRNMQIQIFTDSLSMVQVWSTGTCKDKVVMRLIRALFTFTAERNINLVLTHIPGVQNVAADFLSRLQVERFRQSYPRSNPSPDIPADEVWNI